MGISLENLPLSVFPDEPDKDDLCLVCRIAKRRRHSWFCRIECEDKFIEDRTIDGKVKMGKVILIILIICLSVVILGALGWALSGKDRGSWC